MSSPSATAIATLSTLAAASSPAPSTTSAATSSSTSTHEKVEITKKRKAELKRCEATVKRLKAIISDGTRDHRHSALVHQLFAVSDWIGGDLAEHYQTTVAKRKEEAEKNNDADAEGMHGSGQDETKAFEWYEKAAQRGNEVAMGEAGHRLVDGVGTAKSVRYGVALTLGAAQLGYEVACYNAGTYLQDGIVGGGDHGHGTTCMHNENKTAARNVRKQGLRRAPPLRRWRPIDARARPPGRFRTPSRYVGERRTGGVG